MPSPSTAQWQPVSQTNPDSQCLISFLTDVARRQRGHSCSGALALGSKLPRAYWHPSYPLSVSLSLTSRPCVVTALADPRGWCDGVVIFAREREKIRGESEWRPISERGRIKPAHTVVGQVDLRTLNPPKIRLPQTSLLWRAFYRWPSVDECPNMTFHDKNASCVHTAFSQDV